MNTSILWIVFALLLMGTWFAVSSLKRRMAAAAGDMSSLLMEGHPTTARISATEKRRKSRRQFEYFVTYAFRTRDGADFEKELRVSATHFDDYREGQSIEIVYLPRDPSISATREMVDRVRSKQYG